jgi:hypothetical protein
MVGTALYSIFDRPVLLRLAGAGYVPWGWYIGLHFQRKFPEKCHRLISMCCLSNSSRAHGAQVPRIMKHQF